MEGGSVVAGGWTDIDDLLVEGTNAWAACPAQQLNEAAINHLFMLDPDCTVSKTNMCLSFSRGGATFCHGCADRYDDFLCLLMSLLLLLCFLCHMPMSVRLSWPRSAIHAPRERREAARGEVVFCGFTSFIC